MLATCSPADALVLDGSADLVRGELRRVARQERGSRLEPRQPDPAPHDRTMASEAAAVLDRQLLESP